MITIRSCRCKNGDAGGGGKDVAPMRVLGGDVGVEVGEAKGMGEGVSVRESGRERGFRVEDGCEGGRGSETGSGKEDEDKWKKHITRDAVIVMCGFPCFEFAG